MEFPYMLNHKLANVLLTIDPHVKEYPGLYFQAESGKLQPQEDGSALLSGAVDFTTYLNGLPAEKWKRYTEIEEVWLHLELSGSECDVLLEGAPRGKGEAKLVQTGAVHAAAAQSDPQVIDVQVPSNNMDFVGFAVRTDGTVRLSNCYYYTRIDEADVNHVRLALSTTTYKKESFVIPNIEKVRKSIRSDSGPIHGVFHMFVIDNGRTLDADALSDDLVSVIPNRNVGGAGGFARGMIAALDDPSDFTHILLMDDDVIILPESIKRTFNLLRLARGAYRDAFINGAMLTLERPNLQFEDVSYVQRSGVYRRVKGNLVVDRLADVLANERISVEVPHAYGAWWYSCIPLKRVREVGLPLPVFVRCDDVEFGMRAKPTYMTMSGICVWHQGFNDKFRANVDFYQYIRNFLIMIAVDGAASENMFVSRIARDVRLRLRDLDYEGADLLLDAFDDYLKGPGFLERADGAELMKTKSARNEKMLPVGELGLDEVTLARIHAMADAEDAAIAADPDHGHPATTFFALWESLPYDKHELPDSMLIDSPAILSFFAHEKPDLDIARHTTYIALDPSFRKGAIRHMDRRRYNEVKGRLDLLTGRWRKDGASIRRAYKQELPRMTSMEFWRFYLGMDQASKDDKG